MPRQDQQLCDEKSANLTKAENHRYYCTVLATEVSILVYNFLFLLVFDMNNRVVGLRPCRVFLFIITSLLLLC